MAFAIPIVKQNYALYGSGTNSSCSSSGSSTSSSPVGTPPKLGVNHQHQLLQQHHHQHHIHQNYPPVARSALKRSASDKHTPVPENKSKKNLTRNSHSLSSFHEALVVKLTKAVRKISR